MEGGPWRCRVQEEISEGPVHVLRIRHPGAQLLKPVSLLGLSQTSKVSHPGHQGRGLRPLGHCTRVHCRVCVCVCVCVFVWSDSCWLARESWSSIQIPSWGNGGSFVVGSGGGHATHDLYKLPGIQVWCKLSGSGGFSPAIRLIQ